MSDYIPPVPGSLSTMEKVWEGVKHVGKKALKWAATAGVIAGIGGMIIGAIPIFGVGALAGMWAGVEFGAALGALAGAVSAAGGVPDAIEQAGADSITRYRSAENRARQNAAMDMQLGEKLANTQLSIAERANQLLPGREQGTSRGT